MPETSLWCFQVCNFETPWKYEEAQKGRNGAQIRNKRWKFNCSWISREKKCFWVVNSEPNEPIGENDVFRAYPFAGMLTKTIVACWNGCLILGKREEGLHRHDICQNIYANVVGGGKKLGRKAFIHYTIEIRTTNINKQGLKRSTSWSLTPIHSPRGSRGRPRGS